MKAGPLFKVGASWRVEGLPWFRAEEVVMVMVPVDQRPFNELAIDFMKAFSHMADAAGHAVAAFQAFGRAFQNRKVKYGK